MRAEILHHLKLKEGQENQQDISDVNLDDILNSEFESRLGTVIDRNHLFYQISIQWNLGIGDSQGTVKNCPELWGGLISQVHFNVMNRPRD